MGFHVCEWCSKDGKMIGNAAAQDMRFSPYSSADVTLKFKNGHQWTFPYEGLPHYVSEHGYQPEQEFIIDVMTEELDKESSEFMQTKGLPQRIGYLQYPEMLLGPVPDGFLEKLEALVQQVRGTNQFGQTRGMK